MASTAVSLPNVAEGIAGTYVAQSTEKYISVAMACWFVWDHVTTLDQEAKYIWDNPFNLTKIFFLLVRYGITIGYPASLYQVFTRADTPHVCEASLAFFILFVTVSQAVQMILMLRVWALYNRSWKIGASLVVAHLIVLAIGLQLFADYYRGGQFPVPSVLPGTPQLSGCLMKPVPGYYRGYVATTIFDTIIVGMTIWKVSRHMRDERRIPLLNYLLSSGVCYYLAILAILLLSILSKPFPVLIIPVISSGCILVVQGIACSRIVLGMMRLGEKADRRSPLAEAQTSEGKVEDVQWFLTVPTGLFTRDMMARWEYGLPPIDIGAAETDLPLDVETACAPSVDIYPSPLSA